MVIRRVNPISAAKVFGVLGVMVGLFIGACWSLFAMTVGALAGAAANDARGPLFAMLGGVGAIIIVPIFYGIVGFIGGLIQSALFNLAAKWVGGLEIEAS